MYNSQYYTCEQIDERLLQGYLDDYNTQTGQSLTKAQFLTKLGSIFSKEGVIDNTATQIGYYECDTAAGTAAKTITVANYALFAGGSMKVKFANKNTANNATLNINSQGAKALYYQGERASATNSWDANEVVEIYYDGTSYYANNVKGGSGSGVYDVSKEHPTSGPNSDGKFTLEYILNSSNVNELIPVNKRYPGMTIQFVSTSDNKYVQYRLMSSTWSTTVTDWQGVDDEPTDGSANLVKSGGVYKQLNYISDFKIGYINSNIWKDINSTASNPRSYFIIEVNGLLDGKILNCKGNTDGQSIINFLSAYNPVEDGAAGVLDGKTFALGEEAELTIPNGTNYIYVYRGTVGNPNRIPLIMNVEGIDFLKSIKDNELILVKHIDTIIQAEAQARQQGDSTLQGNIDAEAQARKAATKYIYDRYRGYINNNVWTDIGTGTRYYFVVKLDDNIDGKTVHVVGSADGISIVYFMSAFNPVEGGGAGVLGGGNVAINTAQDFVVPAGSKYMYVFDGSGNRLPQVLTCENIDFLANGLQLDILRLTKRVDDESESLELLNDSFNTQSLFFANKNQGYINNNIWTDLSTGNRYYNIVPIGESMGGKTVHVKASSSRSSLVYFLNAYNPVEGGGAGVVAGQEVATGQEADIVIPMGAYYMYVFDGNGSGNAIPQELYCESVDFLILKDSLLKISNHVSSAISMLGELHQGYVSGGNWYNISDTDKTRHYVIDLGSVREVSCYAKTTGGVISFLSAYNPVQGESASLITNIAPNLPENTYIKKGRYIIIPAINQSGNSMLPDIFMIDGVDVMKSVKEAVVKCIERMADTDRYYKFLSTANQYQGYINNNKWTDLNTGTRFFYIIPVNGLFDGNTLTMKASSNGSAIVEFLSEFNPVEGESASHIGSTQSAATDTQVEIIIPSGTNYIYVFANYSNRLPVVLKIGDLDLLGTVCENQLKTEKRLEDVEEYISGQFVKTSILALNPKSEILPKLVNLQKRYITYGGNAEANPPCLTLLHFSDAHSLHSAGANYNNVIRIREFADEYSDYLNDVIQTGDLIASTFSEGIPLSYSPNILNTIGNHDTMNYVEGQWVMVDQKQCYDQNIAPYIAEWGDTTNPIVQPTGAAENGYCYYYKDYTAAHVRLVILDNMHWDATQQSWLASVLSDARDTTRGFAYHVLCAVHYPPFIVQKATGNPFASIDTIVQQSYCCNDGIPATFKAHIDAGGFFAGYICGHLHDDVAGFGPDNYSNQFAFSVATAGQGITYSEMMRSSGNRTQDCFNILAVDVTSKTVKVMRVGANYDRYMRRKNTISYDYANSRIITTDM